jgi:hypothetical protein
MIAAKMSPSTLGHDTSVTIQHEILTVGVAGRYVKKSMGKPRISGESMLHFS